MNGERGLRSGYHASIDDESCGWIAGGIERAFHPGPGRGEGQHEVEVAIPPGGHHSEYLVQLALFEAVTCGHIRQLGRGSVVPELEEDDFGRQGTNT